MTTGRFSEYPQEQLQMSVEAIEKIIKPLQHYSDMEVRPDILPGFVEYLLYIRPRYW